MSEEQQKELMIREEITRRTMENYGFQKPVSGSSDSERSSVRQRRLEKEQMMSKRIVDMEQQLVSQAAAFKVMVADALAHQDDKNQRLRAELEARRQKEQPRAAPTFDPWQGQSKANVEQDAGSQRSPPRTPSRKDRQGDVPVPASPGGGRGEVPRREAQEPPGHRRREEPDPDDSGDDHGGDKQGDAWKDYHKSKKKKKKKKKKHRPGGDGSPSESSSSSSSSNSSSDDRSRRDRSKRPVVRSLMRIKAEAEWPKYDNMDAYYDIQEFFEEYERVKGLASQGLGFPPQEELQLLRGAFTATPATEFKTFVDYDDERVRILNTGTQKEQRGLLREVKSHMLTEFHRPLADRQKRAKAEFETNSMRLSPQLAYSEFQAEFKKTVGNLGGRRCHAMRRTFVWSS